MIKSINLLSLWLLGIIHSDVNAQKVYPGDSISLKKRIYKVSITATDQKKNTGYLAGLSDSNLYLSPSPVRLSTVRPGSHLARYSYNQVEKIEIKRKASAARGALQGALIGLAVGVIAGLASGDDPETPAYNNPNDPLGTALNILSNSFRMTAGEKAATSGVVGAGAGGLIGAITGSLLKKKFIIGRDKQKFHSMRQDIVGKLYVR